MKNMLRQCLLFVTVIAMTYRVGAQQQDVFSGIIEMELDDNRLFVADYTNPTTTVSNNANTHIKLGDLNTRYTQRDISIFGTNPILTQGAISGEVHLGTYYTNKDVVVQPQVEERVGVISLEWQAVQGASGYVIFRNPDENDLTKLVAHKVIDDSQLSVFTDYDLNLGKEYTYYILAFNDQGNGDFFIGNATKVVRNSGAYLFEAHTDNETNVTFKWEFDNQLLLRLAEKAAYVEIKDEGLDEVIYGETMALTDIAEEALLFDYSLNLSGDQSNGVYASPVGIGSHSSWTIELWVNPDSKLGSNHRTLISNGSFVLAINDQGALVFSRSAVVHQATSGTVSDEKWSHVTLAYDGSVLTAFINGEPVSFNGETIPVAGKAGAGIEIDLQPLTEQLKVGQGLLGAVNNYAGALGMIRLWKSNRTANQVKEDFEDIFDQSTPDLIAQWVFENEVTLLPDNINGLQLDISSSNASRYPIRWKPSFDFVNSTAFDSTVHWMSDPQQNGAIGDFSITIYEVGTGKQLSANRSEVSFTHPGAPALSVLQKEGAPHGVDITITPASSYVKKYIVSRHDLTTGNSLELTRLAIPDHNIGDISAIQALTYRDTYEEGSDESILAGHQYRYEVVPYYGTAPMDDRDQLNMAQAELSLTHYSFAAREVNQKVELTWDANTLAAQGYDTVRIVRNEESLMVLPSSYAYFADTLMIYGATHSYQLQLIKQGQVSFSEFDTLYVSPNGFISGTLIGGVKSFALRETALALVSNKEGNKDTVEIFTTDSLGRFSVKNIEYGTTNNFEIVSLTKKVLKNASVELSRSNPRLRNLWVTYDTADLDTKAIKNPVHGHFKQSLSVNNSRPNALTLTWNQLKSGDKKSYYNIFRNDVLIGVVYRDTSFTDTTATLGTQDYRVVGYFHKPLGPDDSDFRVRYLATDLVSATHPGLTQASNFIVHNTNQLIPWLTWKYPANAALKGFLVKQIVGNDTLDIAFEQHHFSANDGQSSYGVHYISGVPNTHYSYLLLGITHAGDTLSAASRKWKSHQSLNVNQVLENLQFTVQGNGGLFTMNVIAGRQDWKSWHGVMLRDDLGREIAYAKSMFRNSNGQVRFFVPNLPTVSGSVEISLYKHTDQGLYLTTPEIINYSSVDVLINHTGQTPENPIVTQLSSDLQNIILEASKDARGKIFVAWKYPHYTDVTFEFKRKVQGGSWETFVLGNEERSFLDNDIYDTVEYSIQAIRANGEASRISWDYGVGKQYLQLEGWVYDTAGSAQVGTFVSLDNQRWTITDSAGYYHFGDFETDKNQATIRWIEPNAIDLSINLINVVLNDDQQVFRQDVVVGVDNPVYEENAGIANIAAVVGQADISHLANVIRWKPSNPSYSGFNVYRGIVKMATILKGEEMIFVDSLEDINAGGFRYDVVPFIKINSSISENLAGTKGVEIEFPVLAEPNYANAFADKDQGYVRITWTHDRNNADAYAITRNDEIIGVVNSVSRPVFLDTTGIPNQVYRYEIYSILETDGNVVTSLRSHLLEAKFPLTGFASNLNAQVDYITLNSIQIPDNKVWISWDYPNGKRVEGAALYRGYDSLGFVAYPDTVLYDSLGIPETYTSYYVKTYDRKDGVLYPSEEQEVNIIFPKLQPVTNFAVDQRNIDSVLISWDYVPSGVEGFELDIYNHFLGDTVVHEEIVRNGNRFEYLFSNGVSGVEYTYSVRAKSVRKRQSYYSVAESKQLIHPALPNTIVDVVYSSEEQHARFVWSYPTQKNDGFYVTIKKNGLVYEGGAEFQESAIRYENISLPKNQREFLFIPSFQHLNETGTAFTFVLTPYQHAPGAQSDEVTKVVSIDMGDKSKYPTQVSASDDNPHSVILNWGSPASATSSPTGYIIMRDGKKVTSLHETAQSYEDRNTSPGVKHLYQVVASFGNNEEYARSAVGNKISEGLITVQVKGIYGNAVRGDSIKLTSVVHGHGLEIIKYTDESGEVSFESLPYNREGVTYKIEPVGDLSNYQMTSSNEVTLNLARKQGFAGIFINKLTRTITGQVTNLNCVENDCGVGNIPLVFFTYGNSPGDSTEFAQTSTDDQGFFSLSAPYELSAYGKFGLQVKNTRVDENNQSYPDDSVKHLYLSGDNGIHLKDSSLLLYISKKDMLAGMNNVEIIDTVGFPLQLEVAGPGICDVFKGYEFLLRIKNDEDNGFEKMIWTNDRMISEYLPPYNMTIEVIDVDKRDAFSVSVLDYFRSRRMSVNNKSRYQQYIVAPRQSLRDTLYYFRYNERASLTVSGLDDIQLESCENGLYVLDSDDKTETNEGISQTVTLTPDVSQTINGVRCASTSGYIIPKFPGGKFNLGGDTLIFNQQDQRWESLTITATTPNMAKPHSQLLELHYYDDNGNYQGMMTREIMVLGKLKAPGSDVFIVPEEDNQELVPLYVLRDPPGDKSSAFIAEKSVLSFQLENKRKRQQGLAWERDFNGELFGVKWKNKTKVENTRERKYTESVQYSLEFKKAISTQGKAISSENLEGYLDGPDADVIIGISIVMAYGIVQDLSIDGCEVVKQNILTVDPNEIKTAWAYTRSQIKNTIRYYDHLTDVDPNDPDTYVPAEGTVFGEGSPDDIVNQIGYSKESFEKLLSQVDKEYTPACEMCEYLRAFRGAIFDKEILEVQTLGNKYYDSLYADWGDVQDYCYETIEKNGGCRSINSLLSGWSQEERDTYVDMYKKYVSVREAFELATATDHLTRVVRSGQGIGGQKFYIKDFEQQLQNSDTAIFEPLENITFGAGSKVSRTIEREQQSLKIGEATWSLKSSWAIGFGTVVEQKNSLWAGVGAGTQTGFHFLENKLKSSTTFKPEINFERTGSNSEFIASEFKTGFTLSDDDDGDHFSVDVFHSWTNGWSGFPKSSPFFHIMGGRSSCPHEEGTISRDFPKIQLVDDEGSLLPTKIYDQNPDEPIILPVQVSSGNLFGEDRLVMITLPLNSNQNGLQMEMEGVKINNFRGSVSLIDGQEGFYRTNLIMNRPRNPNFDFSDIKLIAKPFCNAAKGAYWESPEVFDTLNMEVYYRKPTSPVEIEAAQGQWFANADQQSVIFRIKDYEVEQIRHDLKEIFVEYKRENEQYWNRMESEEGIDVFSSDTLLAFYKQKLNTYQDPQFPLVWNLTTLPDLNDGRYQVRASAVHSKGFIEYSSILSGQIDRTRPRVSGYPQPADSLLSLGDEVSVTFDEVIDCEHFFDYLENSRIHVLNDAGEVIDTLAYMHATPEFSEYDLTCTGSGITITIDKTILEQYDGQIMEVSLGSIQDYLGNTTRDNHLKWSFKLDFFKKTPSPVALWSLSDPYINMDNIAHPKELTVRDYDVFKKSYGLDRIDLEYKHVDQTVWKVAATKSRVELRDEFLLDQLPGEVPESVFELHGSGLIDGTYELRAVTHSAGQQAHSNVITVVKDTIRPEVLGLPYPQDSVLMLRDEIRIDFTESINREEVLATWISVYNTSDLTKVVDYSTQVLDKSIIIDIAPSERWSHQGDKLGVTISNITDRAGNALKEGNVAWTFIVDTRKDRTSPVSIQYPDQLVLNAATVSKPVDVVVDGFDLYQEHSALSSISLEYRLSGDRVWTPIAYTTLSLSDLMSGYEASVSLTAPADTIAVDLSLMPEGDFMLRAVAKGGAFPVYSEVLTVKKDTIAPKLSKSSAPADKLYSLGDEITVEFLETVKCISKDQVTVTLTRPNGSESVLDAFALDCKDNGFSLDYNDRALQDAYGSTIKVTVDTVYDLVGNLKRGVNHHFLIDNLSVTHTDVNLYSPEGVWKLNTSILNTKLVFGGYDLSNSDLDSIIVDYRHIEDHNWRVFGLIERADLVAANSGNSIGNDPEYGFNFNLETGTSKDGQYLVRGIVFKNGVAYQTNYVVGNVDFSPLAINNSIQKFNQVVYTNDRVTVNFTEAVDVSSVDPATVRLYQIVGDINPSSRTLGADTFQIDPSYYQVMTGTTDMQIALSDEFYEEYDNIEVMLIVEGVTDLSGNAIEEPLSHSFMVSKNSNESTELTLGVGTGLRGVMHSNGFVELIWSNPSTQNNSGYELQMSSLGEKENFYSVDYIPMQAEDAYQYYHKPNATNIVYYRLKQMGENGFYQYSKVIMMNQNGTQVIEGSVIFPNPSNGESFNLILDTDDLENHVLISIYDLNGARVQEMKQRAKRLLKGKFQLKFDRPLETGIYTVVLEQDGKTEKLRLKVDKD